MPRRPMRQSFAVRWSLAAMLCLATTACAGGLPRELAQVAPDPALEAGFTRMSPLTVELAQASHVLVLDVIYPSNAEPDHPILFSVRYPMFPTDRREFDAGAHRVRPRQRPGFWPMNCQSDETPAIDGCRRPFYLLPGASGYRASRYPLNAVLLIVSDVFRDPYPLAEELYWKVLQEYTIHGKLVGADVATLRDELEPILLGVLGPRGWTASFASWLY